MALVFSWELDAFSQNLKNSFNLAQLYFVIMQHLFIEDIY